MQTGNLLDGLQGPWKPKRDVAQVFGVCQGVWIPIRTYRCLSMPRCLDLQTGLCTGVWIPNRGYTQVLGVPTAAILDYLESQPRLHTGVWSPNRRYTQVFGVPTAAAHRCVGAPNAATYIVWSRSRGYTRLGMLILTVPCQTALGWFRLRLCRLLCQGVSDPIPPSKCLVLQRGQVGTVGNRENLQWFRWGTVGNWPPII